MSVIGREGYSNGLDLYFGGFSNASKMQNRNKNQRRKNQKEELKQAKKRNAAAKLSDKSKILENVFATFPRTESKDFEFDHEYSHQAF